MFIKCEYLHFHAIVQIVYVLNNYNVIIIGVASELVEKVERDPQ